MDNDDEMSLLAKLRALQGAQQGTPDAKIGMMDAMKRVREKMNAPQQGMAPPINPPPPANMDTPPGPGALSPEERAMIQQKVDAMNANIKARDSQQTQDHPEDSEPDQAADYLQMQKQQRQQAMGMAHGGTVERFHKLMQMMGKKK